MACAEHDWMLIERYLDGELAPALVGQAEAALESCAACRLHFEELSEVRVGLQGMLQEAADAAPLEGLWASIEDELEFEAAPARRPSLVGRLHAWWQNAWETRRLEMALGAMAGACAILVGVWVVGSIPATGPTADPAIPHLADITGTNGAAKPGPQQADNRLIVEATEVREGVVIIDADPDDPNAPTVVWHLMDDEMEEERS